MSQTQKGARYVRKVYKCSYLLLEYCFTPFCSLASVVVRVCCFFYQKGNNLPNKCFIVTYLQKYWSEIKDERGIKNTIPPRKTIRWIVCFLTRDFSECVFFLRFDKMLLQRCERWWRWITWHLAFINASENLTLSLSLRGSWITLQRLSI